MYQMMTSHKQLKILYNMYTKSKLSTACKGKKKKEKKKTKRKKTEINLQQCLGIKILY